MKKLIFAVLLAVALTMVLTGTAFADFAIHGGYVADTDACAGCHRAHTSFSAVGRTNYADGTRVDDGSALLVGSASTMKEFCLTCHGAAAPGASTDVVTGVFSSASGPSGAIGGTVGESYHTNSVDGAILNGGSFGTIGVNTVSSQHDCDAVGAVDPLWGAGNSAATFAGFTCTSCHDPHGSTNYRILKDKVGPDSAIVGGYSAAGVAQPFVLSAERGYPANGWAKASAMTDMANYYPDYTTPRYRASSGLDIAAGKGMSGWCSGCHTQYNVQTGTRTAAQTPGDANLAGTYNYGSGETVWPGGVKPSPYSATPAAPAVGYEVRHRHPVNVTLQAGYGGTLLGQSLAVQVNLGDALWSGARDAANETTGTPLELAYNKDYSSAGTNGAQIANEVDDVLGCLTCHKAHGTAVTMRGWARGRLVYNAAFATNGAPEWQVATGLDVDSNADGVNPNASSSLLRIDNRGVCENCHAK